MSNPWNILSANYEVGDDSFNDVVSGSKFMEEGFHPGCTIQGVEPATSRNGNPYVKFIWGNQQGQSYTDNVFLTARPDDNGVIKPHFTYRRLLSGLIGDITLRQQFADLVKKHPGHLASLVGLSADLTVGAGKEGYTAKKLETGGVVLYDVATNTQIGEDVFAGFREASEFAKTSGLSRAWPELKELKQSSGVEANEQTIRAVVAAATKPAAGQGGSPVRTVAAATPRRSI